MQRNHRLHRFAASLLALLLVSTSMSLHAYGQDAATLVDEIKKKQEAVQSGLQKKTAETTETLNSERQRLSERQKELAEVESQISNYEQEVEKLRGEIRTLANQLTLIENNIALTQLRIRSVLIQIAEKEQDIVTNTENVGVAETAVLNQQDILRQFVSLIYKQDLLYFARGKGLSTDPTLYVADGGVTTVIARKRYLETLRDTGTSMLRDFRDIGTLLEVQRTQLASDQRRLVALKEQLGQEERNLADQRTTKTNLLEVTQGQESNFNSLLEQSRLEEEQIEAEVQSMQENIKEIEARIRTIQSTNLGSSSLSASEIEQRKKVLESLGATADGKLGLSWPVEPKRGLSAYFRDPSYQSVFSVPHNAIDVPAPQGTEIKAPADGYVTKAKDSGLGYSYIIIAHAGGVMTLYGHVNQIWVKAGDYVSRGQAIGKSGGQPGTAGAGWMTTGAHLHFEVFQDGKHVDPLGYLDASVLPKK